MRRASIAVCLFASLACGDVPSELAGDRPPVGHAADAAPPIDDSDVPHKVVFATSGKHDGDFGGLAGADQICAEHAQYAGLAGEFKAWLSSPDESAEARLAHADISYARTDGARVAAGWDDLVDGELVAPIDRDEGGVPVSGDAWTGTLPSGGIADFTCAGFASRDEAGVCGSSSETGASWTESSRPPCTSALRLYCVEQ